MGLQPVNHSLGKAKAEGQHPAESAPIVELAPLTPQKQTRCFLGRPAIPLHWGGQPPLQSRQGLATMGLWDFPATFKSPFLPALSQDGP